MESPVPFLSPTLTAMANEILGENDHIDFDSDDSMKDPDFNIEEEVKKIDKNKTMKSFYENFSIESNKNAAEECSSPNVNLVSIINENEALMKSVPSSYMSSGSEILTPKISRKKKLLPGNWKQNVRKKLRQQGKEYISTKGTKVDTKKIKEPCTFKCFYLCTKNISEFEREQIFTDFWKLDDEKKNAFYSKFVKRKDIDRRRIKTSTKKKHTFIYFFEINGTTHQVCKKFFLNSLDTSEIRIYYYFKNVHNEKTGIPNCSKKGKHIKKKTSAEEIDKIKNHIESFATISSHYCRASSTRKYLEQGLTIRKMFDLFQQEFPSDPIKFCIYSKTFNEGFNLAFYKPKKDQCDRCVIYKKSGETFNNSEKQRYESHRKENQFLKLERDLDRNNKNKNVLIICFDMQSVFSLPKGFASSFYYKRKLTVFNLTATACFQNTPSVTYCALWNEIFSGRSGNDLASALVKILRKILEDTVGVEHLVLWSDSCVPQNKNKIMSTALLQFLCEHPAIKSLTQKFSEPGHSRIQEVDAVHSTIDGFLKGKEIHSPLDLFKKLQHANFPKVKLCLIQMTKNIDFKNCSLKACKLNFQTVPFTKIKILKYSASDLFTIEFKTSAAELQYQTKSVLSKAGKSNLQTPHNLFNLQLRVLDSKPISDEKVKDIKSLFIYLPKLDVDYFKCLFKTS